jgi:BASS family bile acid:Na+ symporter
MEIVTKIAPIALAIIMLGLGLGLTIQDFTRVLKTPKDFLVGFVSQLIILPIVAFALIKVLGTSPEMALGVMIIAAAPGGITSNVLTKFAKGDVALSVTLTAVISIISIITVPLIVFTSADLLGISFSDENINITGTALKMALVVAVPVILGMIIRKFAENFISSKISFIDKVTGILFLIVFIAIWIEEGANITTYLAQAGLAVLTLNIAMMIIAYYLAKTFASGIEQIKCISLECGLQNGTLAVFVATQISNEIVYMIPTAAYALIMYITGFIFIYFLRNKV